jgi:hypothetical protein
MPWPPCQSISAVIEVNVPSDRSTLLIPKELETYGKQPFVKSVPALQPAGWLPLSSKLPDVPLAVSCDIPP